MARRRKPGDAVPAPKKPVAAPVKRESKKPKAVVRDYVKERWYGNN